MADKKPAEKQSVEVTCAGCGAHDLKENMVQQGKDQFFCAACAEQAEEQRNDTTAGFDS